MSHKIESIIASWIEENAKKYHGITTDITPERQGEALLQVFSWLKEEGFSDVDVLRHIQKICSPLAPKDIKALKKISKHKKSPDDVAKKKLSIWCLRASEKLVAAFNEVYYGDSDISIPVEPIYKDMCRKRRVSPIETYTSKPTSKDIQDHLDSTPIEGLAPVNAREINIEQENDEISDDETSIDDILNKFKMFKPNPKNVFSEFPEVSSGPDPDALKFFDVDESGDTYE
jgi:hypothetical protein